MYLHAPEAEDLERTWKWHNDPELYKTLLGTFHYVSRATEEDWLGKKLIYSPQELNLAICLRSDSQHIGNVYLRSIDWFARHGEVELFLGEVVHRSKGYGQAAMRLLVKYAFHDLGLVRLYSPILEDNEPSIRMFEKCGFVLEGKLRKHAFKDGRLKDVLVMGLVAENA